MPETLCWDCEQPLAAEPDWTHQTVHGTVGLFYCPCRTVNRIVLAVNESPLSES